MWILSEFANWENHYMGKLDNFRVAVLATDGFEESELLEPVKALKSEGASVDIVAPKIGKIQGFQHFDRAGQVEVNRTLDQIQPGEYDAVVLPGGALNADQLRIVDRAQLFVRSIQDSGKPIAVICHGSWLLVSADLVRYRKITSYHTIRDDIRNGGGHWVDQEVVVDRNLISSRMPQDLPAFNREVIRVFSEYQAKKSKRPAA
jgi:protease I